MYRNARKRTTRTRKTYRRKYTNKTKYNRRGRKRAYNNRTTLTMRAPLASNNLNVKIPWAQTFDFDFNNAQTDDFIVLGGNHLVPHTDLGQTDMRPIPGAGDSFPGGILEYSRLYDKYVCYGSSLYIEAVNASLPANTVIPTIRAVLLAVPYSRIDTDNINHTDSWDGVRNQLNSYTYDQLLVWPGAKFRMIASGYGGNNRLVFKMYRSTRSLLGVKDMRDNNQWDYGLGGYLPDGQSNIPEAVIRTQINPAYGFMYFLKLFASTVPVGQTFTVQVTVRMKLYMGLSSREFNPSIPITINP